MFYKLRVFILFIFLFFFIACKQEVKYDYPFQNPGLPVDERIDDLVSKLTL
jgi:beta-glucosidase